MAAFQGILFTLIGLLLAVMAIQSLRTGWLPAKGRVERDTLPGIYWLMFLFYLLGGLWMAGFGLAVLGGYAAPLPIRSHP